jgi:hypothetical protein
MYANPVNGRFRPSSRRSSQHLELLLRVEAAVQHPARERPVTVRFRHAPEASDVRLGPGSRHSLVAYISIRQNGRRCWTFGGENAVRGD